jgi:prepilin-type processing-associated H-X9-DG protein/prepilin-type N-terminal cleavage/methylation domain-containing protein
MNTVGPALSAAGHPDPNQTRGGAVVTRDVPPAHSRSASSTRLPRLSVSPRRSGFSLLELLVVSATIALLLAIVVPTLGRAREEGKTAHCLASLHNAGLAVTLYLEDNDGTFWPYYTDIPAPDGGRRWWFGFEPNGPPPDSFRRNRYLDKSGGFLSAYLTGSAEDFRCPAFPYSDGKYFPKFCPPAGGYGYNLEALGASIPATQPATGRRIQQFDGQTADVFALADGIHFDRLSYSGSTPLEQSFNEPAYIQWQDPTSFGSAMGVNGGFAHFRHNGRAMVLFLDSHAAGQPPRRPLHPYSGKGYGLVANLSDESLRVRQVVRGGGTFMIDLIYGLE